MIRSPRGASSPTRHVDLLLVGATIGIAALGLLMVYSSTRRQQTVAGAGVEPNFYVKRQALFLIIGLALMVLMVVVDYRVLQDLAPPIYVGTVVLLLLVFSPLGTAERGAQAWFQVGSLQFEPSELAKLALIIGVSAYCAAHRADLDARRLIVLLGLASVPMVLIYLQPDLGTDMVFGAILLGTLLVAGARPKHMAVLGGIGLLAVLLVLQLGVLKAYQIDRLAAFLDPEGDAQRSAYNLRQSQIAIAAGGMTGRGVFQGSQTNLSFVPEQHTDFIFTAVAEELGFLGAATLLALFALLMWRTWRTAVLARDRFGTLVCVGVLSMLAFQVFENVGMTMGITPIAGIPLPLVSYGGSAMLTSFLAIGLVLNVHMRRFS
ncbi:MAG: rod shape-determining protein RodA [Actinomycetota bacterium]|nr:rod shape-determining protein RodA [Actinomycetota bacterium]